MRKAPLMLAVLACILSPSCLKAQKVALKSNALYWAAVAPNFGLEIQTGRKFSMDISGNYNPFNFSDTKDYRFWTVQPEYRYWFCETFNGSFIGAHLHGGEFNLGGLNLPLGAWPALKENRYDGYFYGGGIVYGHHWIISNRWSFEAVAGGGYARIVYDKYPCAECSPKIKSGNKNYFGPTKIALTFMFFIK